MKINVLELIVFYCIVYDWYARGNNTFYVSTNSVGVTNKNIIVALFKVLELTWIKIYIYYWNLQSINGGVVVVML